MVVDIIEILNSLDQRDQKFRDQVAKLREFRETLRKSGASVESDGFSVPLMSRIEPPHENIAELFKVAQSGKI